MCLLNFDQSYLFYMQNFLFLFILFYYRVILTLSTSVYVRSGVSVCACTFLAVIELLFGSVLKVGFYIMKWNVIYKCVCVCVRACMCVELLFCLSQSQTQNYILHWNITHTYSVCVHACARAGVSMCVWVLFCQCKWAASSCMSVLLFAYVCMLTAFETLSL